MDSSQQDEKQQKQVKVDELNQEDLKSPIQYTPIGIGELIVNADDTEINFIKYRIPKIEGIDICINLQVLLVFCFNPFSKKLSLRTNLVCKIEGLQNCINLEELELYDNKIKKLENLENLTNLKYY